MANYIRNRISFQGKRERIDEVFRFMQGENGIMDFDKIIPMPQTYKDYDTTNYPDGVGIEDEAKKLEYKKATKEQKKKYGFVGWYDWRVYNWGSKWNACDCKRLEDTIMFDTAWSGVPKIVAEIAKRFPDLYMEYDYADENAGYNVGTGWCEDGQLYLTEEEGGSDEAWNVYFDLWGGEEDYEKVYGKWRLKEDY